MDNIDIVNKLLVIDNTIMRSNLTIDDVFRKVPFTDISFDNSLLIYNGDINITKKLINSNISNCILYPNYSFLGINKYLVKDSNDLVLSDQKNDYYYQDHQNEFDNIVVFNDILLYECLKNYYKDLKFYSI